MIENILTFIGALVLVVALIVGIGALMALPVMWLWNGVMPNLFAADVVRPINFWNAWGLLILCGLLFRSTTTASKD